jgi:hypothetical protein
VSLVSNHATDPITSTPASGTVVNAITGAPVRRQMLQ